MERVSYVSFQHYYIRNNVICSKDVALYEKSKSHIVCFPLFPNATYVYEEQYENLNEMSISFLHIYNLHLIFICNKTVSMDNLEDYY